jgi:DNA-binding MarR family transcriptional regulator
LTSAELARNSFVTNQTTADLVNSLERQGLIARSRDPDDRRRVLITLTERGAAVVAEHSERVLALEQRMVTDLTKPQIRAFGRALNACRTALSAASPGDDEEDRGRS